MRFLFLAPLSTARHCQLIHGVGAALQQQGHDIHVFARDTTNVVHNGTRVLSRNKVHVDGLRQALGAVQVSRLHSHPAKVGARLDLLSGADEAQLGRFAAAYAPDAIVLSCDELLDHDEPLLRAARRSAAPSIYARLRATPARWTLEVGSHGAVPLPRGEGMRKVLSAHLLRHLDAKASQARLSSLLKSREAELNALLGRTAIPAVAQLGTGVVLPKATVPAEPVASTAQELCPRGEIESIKDDDVILGESLWVKGWLDFSHPALKGLVIRVNDRTQRCAPGAVRGELVDRHGRANIVGFAAQVPIAEEGPRLNVSVSLLTADGQEHLWKKVVLWGDRSVPAQYKTPVARGQAEIVRDLDGVRIVGSVVVDGYAVRTIRALQLGTTLASHDAAGGPAAQGFSFPLAAPLDVHAPVHLWLALDGAANEVFWIRLYPAAAMLPDERLRIGGLEEGDVVYTEAVDLALSTSAGATSACVYINGLPAGTAAVAAGQGLVHARLAHHASSMLVEVRDETGAYGSRHAWRYHEDAAARAFQTLVSLPSERRFAPRAPAAATPTPARVVLIRRNAAPTDELYVVAPLRKLVARGAVQLEVVDTDTARLDEAALDALLTPGAHVIVSRYVTDALIKQLSARKSQLGSIFYLMDDDVVGAEDSRWLPANYRGRMMRVAHGEFQAMVSLCDRFIVTCAFLHQRYGSAKTDLLEPPFLEAPGDLDHLDSTREVVIAYHGTMAHCDDISAISPALRDVHDRHRNVRIQIVMGKFVPPPLKGLARVEVIPAMPWDAYKAYARTCRAHIALAPILETPYNLGKSIIKIMDIAALGAVGVYSRRPPYTQYVRHGRNGLLVENDPLMWQKTLGWLVEHPKELKRLALAGQTLAREAGDIGRLESYWINSLRLG